MSQSLSTIPIAGSIVLCLKRCRYPLFAVNTEECWQKELFCITTTLNHIWQLWPLKQFRNWNLSFSSLQETVQISPHLITIFSDHSKMCLQMMKRSRTQCLCDFVHNQKHSSGSSWAEVTNVWRSLGITLKNDNILVIVYLLQSKENNKLILYFEFPSYFDIW